jgi:hypothetical protein
MDGLRTPLVRNPTLLHSSSDFGNTRRKISYGSILPDMTRAGIVVVCPFSASSFAP